MGTLSLRATAAVEVTGETHNHTDYGSVNLVITINTASETKVLTVLRYVNPPQRALTTPKLPAVAVTRQNWIKYYSNYLPP